jgi:hypothetical protein
MPRIQNRSRANSGATANEFWRAATSKGLTQTYREFLKSQEKRINQAAVSAALRAPSPAPAPAPAIHDAPAPIIPAEFKIHTAANELVEFLKKYIASSSIHTFSSIIAETQTITKPYKEKSNPSSPVTLPTAGEGEYELVQLSTEFVSAQSSPPSMTAETAKTQKPNQITGAESHFRTSVRDEEIYCFEALRKNFTDAITSIAKNPSIRDEKSSTIKKTHQLINRGTYQRNQSRRHFLKRLENEIEEILRNINIDFTSNDLIKQTLENNFISAEAAKTKIALCANQMFGQLFSILARIEICATNIEFFLIHSRNVSGANKNAQEHHKTFTELLALINQCSYITQHIANDLFKIFIKFKLDEFQDQFNKLPKDRQQKFNGFTAVSNPIFSAILASYNLLLPDHLQKIKEYKLTEEKQTFYDIVVETIATATTSANKRTLEPENALEYAQAMEQFYPGLSFFIAKIQIIINTALRTNMEASTKNAADCFGGGGGKSTPVETQGPEGGASKDDENTSDTTEERPASPAP